MGVFMEQLEDAGLERLFRCTDRDSGLMALIALDSTVRGPAFGGIRRRRFAGEDAARAEVSGLARAMTQKCALAGLPAGGGKTVVLDGPMLDPVAGYAALGEAVESLGGRYVCGPDVGTGTAELDAVRTRTRHVNPAVNDAGRSTADGVLAGLRGVLRVLDGERSFAGRRVVVQGLGAVGLAIIERLRAEGATVWGSDVDVGACARGARLGAEIVPPPAALCMPCDVLMPCALGGVLTSEVVPTLQCRAVCGSANNQLSQPEVAELLRGRGIVHAPDIVVSAGAVIEGVWTVLRGFGAQTRRRIEADVAGIESTAWKVLETAAASGCTPLAVARARAEVAIAEHRA